MEPRVPFAASCDPTTAALLAHTFTLAPVMITADECRDVAKAMAVVYMYRCREVAKSLLRMERSRAVNGYGYGWWRQGADAGVG